MIFWIVVVHNLNTTRHFFSTYDDAVKFALNRSGNEDKISLYVGNRLIYENI